MPLPRLASLFLLLAAVSRASSLSLSPRLPAARTRPLRMMSRARYEDADDRRLSQGGSGGRYGATARSFSQLSDAEKRKTIAKRGFSEARYSTDSQRIRAEKLDAYLYNDEEATDGTIGKIIAGSMLVSIFSGLFGTWMYYGGDGLMAAARL
jgi:hypothetical protein